MAAIVTRVSDWSDSDTENVSTESFVFNGQAYEIDLGDEGRKAMEAAFVKAAKLLAPFTSKATEVKGGKAKSANENAAMRAWFNSETGIQLLKVRGITVGERGRIPAEAQALYREHNS